MKRKRIISLALVFSLVLALSAPAFAIEDRASDQISMTAVSVKSMLSKIIVTVDIISVGIADKLGTESIYVWKQVDGGWLLLYDLKEDEDNGEEDMYSVNTGAHMAEYYFDSIAGVNYRVDVTLFAENDEGRDTVSRTYYVTGKSGVSR